MRGVTACAALYALDGVDDDFGIVVRDILREVGGGWEVVLPVLLVALAVPLRLMLLLK